MRHRLPAPLPWRRPQAELLLLALVAVTALSQVYQTNVQDVSRVCLAKALVAGRLSDDACFARTIDRSSYGGHLYSNKAPGMSVLEILPAEAVRLPTSDRWAHEGDLRLWAVRLFASGVPFMLCVFLVGRISEGLAPGFGAPTLVTFALGTLMGPLATSCFAHVLTAMLGFLAFVLSWRRRPLAAGLAAGAALTTEYEAAAILLIVTAYTALQGKRSLVRYALGAVPGITLLGAYDWLAFGAPWHSAVRYSNDIYGGALKSGLLGIHLPSAHSTQVVFVGDRGLLVTSPVLLVAVIGLTVLWRGGLHAEVLTCAAVSAAFVIANCGYFAPNGGNSPGPRYLVPALPFLAVGLGPAFARLRVVTTLLAGASIVATTAVMLTWPVADPYRETIWGEIARVFTQRGSSALAGHLDKNVLVWGSNRLVGAVLVSILAAVTFLLAIRPRRLASATRPAGTARRA